MRLSFFLMKGGKASLPVLVLEIKLCRSMSHHDYTLAPAALLRAVLFGGIGTQQPAHIALMAIRTRLLISSNLPADVLVACMSTRNGLSASSEPCTPKPNLVRLYCSQVHGWPYDSDKKRERTGGEHAGTEENAEINMNVKVLDETEVSRLRVSHSSLRDG